MDENVYTQAEVENVFDEEANLALNVAVVKVQDVPGLLMQNLNHGINKLHEEAGLSLEDKPLPLLFAIQPGKPEIFDIA
jgi:hypothetical protein